MTRRQDSVDTVSRTRLKIFYTTSQSIVLSCQNYFNFLTTEEIQVSRTLQLLEILCICQVHLRNVSYVSLLYLTSILFVGKSDFTVLIAFRHYFEQHLYGEIKIYIIMIPILTVKSSAYDPP